jgi:hypothetical protein
LAPYARSHRISILFFSEDEFPVGNVQEWKQQFHEVGDVLLIDVSSKAYSMPPPLPKYGYKWMCKFFTVDLYEYLLPYDYYLRLDSDNILISSPSPSSHHHQHPSSSASSSSASSPSSQPASSQPAFSYDVLRYVEENEIEYGYVIRKYEPHQETQQSLPGFIESYIDKCHTKPTIPAPPFDLLFNFYNNFHIGKVSFFLQPKVRHYLVSTNTSGNLYKSV